MQKKTGPFLTLPFAGDYVLYVLLLELPSPCPEANQAASEKEDSSGFGNRGAAPRAHPEQLSDPVGFQRRILAYGFLQ